MVNLLATSTKYYCSLSSLKILCLNFLSPHHNTLNKSWLSSWRSLSPNHAIWHRKIFRFISLCPWFHHLDLLRSKIVNFSRLRLCHNILPYNLFQFSLNLSPFYTLHKSEAYCNICHILFKCPSFSYERSILLCADSHFTATPLSTLNVFLILVLLSFSSNY